MYTRMWFLSISLHTLVIVATRWPSMGCCDQPHHRSVLIAGKTFREVSHHSWDASQRLLDMQVEKVDRQVLSPMPELLSYWFDVDDAVRMCGHMNHTIANMVNSSPESFYGLGMVPLQDPERAASEMSRLRADYGLLLSLIHISEPTRPY